MTQRGRGEAKEEPPCSPLQKEDKLAHRRDSPTGADGSHPE